jgi:signal transduction histidine kinase
VINIRSRPIISLVTDGSIVASLLLIGILSLGHLALNYVTLLSLLVTSVLIFIFLIFCKLLLHSGKRKLAAMLIISFYLLVAIYIAITEGTGSPYTLLVYCLYILITGVLMGGAPLVKATFATILTLFTIQIATDVGLLPDPAKAASLGHIASYSVLYGVFALIGWSTTVQIETTLNKLRQARAETLHQKNLLAQALESEEYRLKKLQVEELNNLHQLAEVGQQTTLLFHEFANQLMNLSFDLEDNTTQSRKRAQTTLKDIESTMQAVRQQLSTEHYEAVQLPKVITEVIKEHKAKLQAGHIRLTASIQPQDFPATVFGDTLKLKQILNILIDNAIQAYTDPSQKNRHIKVIVTTTQDKVQLKIIDNGSGIGQTQRSHLFKATHTTKLNGHGIGLYITKRTIERQFHGTLELSDSTKHTEFIITLRRIA